MFLLAAESTFDLVARGAWNAIKAIPIAIWRTHPHSLHGPYHVSYTVTWLVVVIVIILATVRFLRSQ